MKTIQNAPRNFVALRSRGLGAGAIIFCAIFLSLTSKGTAETKLAAKHTATAHDSAGLEAVLSQMDAAAAKFHSAQADFQWDQLERVVNNTDTQTGTIYFVRSADATQMAAQVKQFNHQPEAKDIVYKAGVLEFYQPSIDQMTILHAGQNQARFESFLTLGFGGSGSDLKKNWTVTDQGTETIDGVKTVKLDLVGKQESVRDMFQHVTIWVDPARAISFKQQFFEPSGDTRTAFYRNIRYNQKVSASAFHIKITSKTTKVNR